MKNGYTSYLLSLLIISVILYSCNSDTPSPTVNVKVVDTTKSTIIKDTTITYTTSAPNGSVNYALIVQVLPLSSSNSNDYSFNTGNVTINVGTSGTYNGTISNGIVTFDFYNSSLPAGSVQGTITGVTSYNSSTGVTTTFSSANFTANIDPNGSGSTGSNAVTNKTATVTVYLTPLNCSLNAGFYGDFSFLNNGVADPSEPEDFLQPYTPNNGLYTAPMTVSLDYLDNSIEPNIYTTTYTIGQQQQQLFTNLPSGKAVLHVSYIITNESAIVSNPNANQTETITFDAPFSYTDTITFYNNAAIDLGFKPLIYNGVLTPLQPQ